ncbi:MAG: ABC transporter ATP-binding protein/permease, partial [Myxococcota bacterium]
GRHFARALWRLIRVYWTSPDAKWGALLLASAIGLELGTVYGNFLLSVAERQTLDALEQKQAGAFFAAIGVFAIAMLGFALVSSLRVYLRQQLEIRWRRGLTAHYLERWSGQAYTQAELHLGEVDNPDQRIAEDVRDFVASALGLSLSLLSAVVTLLSFGGLLFSLSRSWPLALGGMQLQIPGLMLWVAVGYAVLSTWLTHLVGRPLVPLNFDRLRFEADFRYGLVRFRDNVEAVALSRGEDLERRGALERFRSIMGNWRELIRAQFNLTLLTTGIGQANGLVPLLVAAPAYIAGHLTLGGIAQIRFAYGQVSGALTWFVYAYQEIARWRANIERLASFADVMDATAFELENAGVRVVPAETPLLRLDDLRLESPDGNVLLERANATAAPGERIAIGGPSGTGKTILLRALAGIWPFGEGRIEMPARASTLFLPQRPYLPLGSLRAVLSYPAPEGTHTDERIAAVLRLLNLAQLEGRLGDVKPWDQHLSPYEQQLVALARVLLNEPQWVFLDMATSELDEEMEQRVYALLAERLPHSTLISVAQRAAVEACHARRWTVTPSEHGPAVLRAA